MDEQGGYQGNDQGDDIGIGGLLGQEFGKRVTRVVKRNREAKDGKCDQGKYEGPNGPDPKPFRGGLFPRIPNVDPIVVIGVHCGQPKGKNERYDHIAGNGFQGIVTIPVYENTEDGDEYGDQKRYLKYLDEIAHGLRFTPFQFLLGLIGPPARIKGCLVIKGSE